MKGQNNTSVRKEVWITKKTIRIYEKLAKEHKRSVKQMLEMAIEASVKNQE